MSTDNVALTHRWFDEVWNQGRVEAIDEMAAKDAVGHGQAEHGADIHGLEEFKPFVRSLRAVFPDIKITIDLSIAEGEHVAVHWHATMTHKGQFLDFAPTGKNVTITGTSIQRIVNGKIVEGWDNWDQLALLVQIGAVPTAKFLPRERQRRSA